MRRRPGTLVLVGALFLATVLATPGSAAVGRDRSTPAASAARGAYRPDLWIKLCGLSTGCTIDPLPHKWFGNDVYNQSGFAQKVAVRMQDGEDVRFWLWLENDAPAEDTFVVQGCPGTHQFEILAVKVGFLKRPNWRPKDITNGFKDGTATFSFPPAADGKKVPLTVAFVAPTMAEGVSYSCPITIHSQSDPSVSDTVVATMTTY